MSKFKVGDKIRCTDCYYAYTNQDALVEVVSNYDVKDTMGGLIRVKIIKHSSIPEVIGHEYDVFEEHFELEDDDE